MFVPLNAIHWTDCKIHHNLKPLKYRHLLLGEHFGNFKFQTKTHSGIIPADLEKTGKELLISNELVYIRDNKSKQKRLNTPQKLPETSTKRSLFSMNNEQIVLDDDDYLHIDNIESENQDPNKEYVEYLCSLVPSVVEELREAGQLDTYITFNELLYSKTFPMDNICYLLFMDVMV